MEYAQISLQIYKCLKNAEYIQWKHNNMFR